MARRYYLIPYRDILTQAPNFDVVTIGSDYIWVNEIPAMVSDGLGQVRPFISKFIPMKICEANEGNQGHEDIIEASKESWNDDFPDNQIPEACVMSFSLEDARNIDTQRINYIANLISLL